MIAYFDCFSGISGDMTLGALVDAGVPFEELRAELAKLGLDGYELRAERTTSKGIAGTRVHVDLHDHDHEHVEGHGHHHEHHHHERHLGEILDIIEGADIAPRAKERASSIFRVLADAEAAIHGISPDKVHFHEVGAVDAIVDIVGAAIGLEILGVEQVYASAVPTGTGMVRCAHGLLPVPAPATLELLRRANAPLAPRPVGDGEMVTPTGAAILCALVLPGEGFTQPKMKVSRIGYGFGTKEFPWPNALRLWVGESFTRSQGERVKDSPVERLEEDTISVIETNIDDMPGELLGAAMESLLAAGALDVYFTPIQMKKNRPAVKLTVLAPLTQESALAEKVLLETTTLGVRIERMSRLKAKRWQEQVDTPWGPATVKVKEVAGVRTASPEYDDCVCLAREHGLSVWDVWRAIASAALH